MEEKEIRINTRLWKDKVNRDGRNLDLRDLLARLINNMFSEWKNGSWVE